MNISRRTVFLVLTFSLLVGAIGGNAAASAKAATGGDQNVNGFLALVGPGGEQVAVYCLGDTYQYSARLDWVGSMVFSGNAFGFECDSQMIAYMFPGYRTVVNTSPTEGWVYDPWSNEARICHDGMMTTLFGGEPGARPDHSTRPSTGCGQMP